MKNEEKKGVLNDGVTRGLGGFNQRQTDLLEKALDAYGDTLKQCITKNTGEITKQTLAVQQGFIAEGHHAASFNINAAAKGVENVNASMDSISAIDSKVDIRITEANGSHTDVQVKYYQNANKSAKAISEPKYNDVGKVVPKEQLADAKLEAGKQAARNQNIRPEVSKNYQNTADNVDDSIRSEYRTNIKSDSIDRKGEGGTEDLTKKINKGEEVEYSKKSEAQSELRGVQYKNALKAGALAGFVSSAASELIQVMRSDTPLSQEECEQIAKNIVVGTATGASKVLLTTGLQHVGSSLAENAGKSALRSVGKSLAKGNVAANAAIMITELSKGLFQYSQGNIDGVEFAENITSSGLNVAAGSAGYAAGVAMAPYIGTMISISVSSVAVAGTTLGALGPVGLGIAVSIASTLAVTSYCEHFTNKGLKIAQQDFQEDMELLKAGEINLAVYTGRVATMSELSFSWSDILPLSGTFSVFGEYKARKSQLKAVQSEIAQRIHDLPDQEKQAMYQLQAGYQQKFAEIEQQYNEMISNINQQAGDKLDQLNDDLDKHLQLRFSINHPVGVNAFREITQKDRKIQIIEQEKAQIQFYQKELQDLLASLPMSSSQDDQKLQQGMIETIKNRIDYILPKVTDYDRAYSFMNPSLSIEEA